jgi:hypothetical protein
MLVTKISSEKRLFVKSIILTLFLLFVSQTLLAEELVPDALAEQWVIDSLSGRIRGGLVFDRQTGQQFQNIEGQVRGGRLKDRTVVQGMKNFFHNIRGPNQVSYNLEFFARDSEFGEFYKIHCPLMAFYAFGDDGDVLIGAYDDCTVKKRYGFLFRHETKMKLLDGMLKIPRQQIDIYYFNKSK